MRRLLRRFVNPISRPAMVFLVWTRRHTVMQWYRSLRAELSRGPLEWRRLMTLGRALVAVATDPRIANSPRLRSLRINGGTIEADVDPSWPKVSALRARLADVGGIVRVEVPAAAPVAAETAGRTARTEELLAAGVASGC